MDREVRERGCPECAWVAGTSERRETHLGISCAGGGGRGHWSNSCPLLAEGCSRNQAPCARGLDLLEGAQAEEKAQGGTELGGWVWAATAGEPRCARGYRVGTNPFRSGPHALGAL